MKLKDKDIKRLLKDEVDKITPDVFTRVKGTPIRGLLDGETPEQAFKKQVVTLLLILTLAILMVLSVSIIAYNATPSEPTGDVSDTYIGITLTRGDEVKKIGIIADTDGRVRCAVNETENVKLDVTGANESSVLGRILTAVDGDAVYVSVINESLPSARSSCTKQLSALEIIYNGKTVHVTYDVNNYNDKCALASYINGSGETCPTGNTASVKTLTDLYVSMAEKLS